MSRDFTFIEDIVEGTFLRKEPNNNEKTNSKIASAKYKIFNIGFGKPANA